MSCPSCGNEQEESSLVISSFCRECGEHFRVKKGVAVADPGLKVSGISEVRTKPKKQKSYFAAHDLEEPGADGNEDAWQKTAEDKGDKARALTQPIPSPGDEEKVGISAGAFFGLVDEDDETAGDGDGLIGDEAKGKEALADGTFGALIDTQGGIQIPEEEKMPANYKPRKKKKNKAGEPATSLKVRCFRCYHIQQVSRHARSTQCERCSVYINLANYEIKSVKSHTLRTRGDITIARKGGLKKSEIACHNLTVNGSFDAHVDASGDVIFRHSGFVTGELYCRRLLIEKDCDVQFPDGVKAERADINGRFIGNLTSSGNVKVSRTGIVIGDIHAASIEIRDGGQVSGATEVDPETSTELPLKMGFNPSIIE